MLTSFRTRLIAFLVGLLVLALAGSFLAVGRANLANAERVIRDDLTEDAAVFARLFDDRTGRLLEAARLLSSDFAFKSAYSTGDPDTILSAMLNHLGRIAGADVMLLVSLDDVVEVDTSAPPAAGVRPPNPWPWLVEAAAADDYGEAAGLVAQGGRVYQMMVVPLLVPDLDAWILIGFEIDDAYAEDLRRLIASQVSILRRSGDGAVAAVAGTLAAGARDEVARGLAEGRLAAGSISSIELGGEDYLASVTPLPAGRGDGGDEVLVALERPLADELAPYHRLQVVLLALFVASLALSVAAAVAIARSVTRPVLELAERAKSIEQGDYGQRVAVDRRDEIGTLAASFNHMARGLAEKERVRDLLGKVVSPAIAEELLSRRIELGGEERVVTVLFSDVRDFTALCEGRAPAEILALLNLYLTEVSRVVERHGGVVDKYIGDAVMALFGAPLTHRDDAGRAVATGLGMVACLAALNRDFAGRALPRLAIGVGIHTGLVVAGNMGSVTRLNYTVIGDAVNLASRLEGLTKRYGVELLVSEATRRAAPEMVYRELDRVRVKGKTEAVAIYQPLGPAGSLGGPELDELERFHRALGELRDGRYEAARRGFAELAAQAARAAGAAAGTADAAAPTGARSGALEVGGPASGPAGGPVGSAGLYRLYLERAERFAARPPEPPWDGTVDFTEK